jgi:hypothetical protein
MNIPQARQTMVNRNDANGLNTVLSKTANGVLGVTCWLLVIG